MVRDRRSELGLKQLDLQARGGPSHATLRNIEQARQAMYSSRTLGMLDRALGWAHGSAKAALSGNRPPSAIEEEETEGPPRQWPNTDDEHALRIGRLVLQLARELGLEP